MAKPATLKVDIVSDSRQARSDLDLFSSKIAGFTAGATAAVTGFAIDKIAEIATSAGSALTDGIEKAANLSASLGTLQRNYGDAAGQLEVWAQKAAKGLGLSEVAAVGAANRFATYARLLGISGQEAATFSTDVIGLAADLAAFNDLPVEDAVNAIGSAFRGERDPLERFGIVLNDAQVKAAYFRKTGEEVNGTLTTQQNIVGTLAALQEQGATAAGSFARESDQLGNKQQVLGAQFDNIKTKIGEILLPAMGGVTDFISGTFLPNVDDLINAFREGGLGGIFDKLSEKWGQAWPKIEEKLSEVFRNTQKWIGEHIPSWDGFLDGIQTAWDKLLAWLGVEVPLLGEKVSGWLRDNLPKVGPWVQAFSEWVDKAVNGDPETGEPGILARLLVLLTSLRTWIEEHSEEIIRYGVLIAGSLNTGFTYLGAMLGLTAMRALMDLKSKLITEGVPWMAETGIRLASAMANALSDFLTKQFSPNLTKVMKFLVSTALNAAFPGLGTAFIGLTGSGDSGGGNDVQQFVNTGPVASATSVEITVNSGFGTNGADVGAAIVQELNDYYARTGSWPFPTG